MGRLKQFAVHWCDLEPTYGHQMKKVRPCVIVSPEAMNDVVATVIIIPLTTTMRRFPFRMNVVLNGRSGSIACDQTRVVDKVKVGDRVTVLSRKDAEKLSAILIDMFTVV